MNYIKSDIPSQFMIGIGVWPPLILIHPIGDLGAIWMKGRLIRRRRKMLKGEIDIKELWCDEPYIHAKI